MRSFSFGLSMVLAAFVLGRCSVPQRPSVAPSVPSVAPSVAPEKHMNDLLSVGFRMFDPEGFEIKHWTE